MITQGQLQAFAEQKIDEAIYAELLAAAKQAITDAVADDFDPWYARLKAAIQELER